MHPVANQLVQLQELIQIRAERKMVAPAIRLQGIDRSITSMSRGVPKKYRDHFESLNAKEDMFIVPVSDMGCAGCGMKLPRSLVQSVKVEKDIHLCPNCARMLYFMRGAPRRVGATIRRTPRRKPGVHRFSSVNLMVPALTAKDRDGAIAELAERMEAEEYVEGADKLVEAALRREAIVSTALARGLAFPHVRGVEGGCLTLALGLSWAGIAFDGLDGKPSKIIFFIVIPTASSAFYLKLLSGLSEAFRPAEARKALLAAKEPEPLWKALVKATRTTIK